MPDGNFAVTRTGSGVTFSEIHGALRQKTFVPLILVPGATLRGRKHTYQLAKYLGEGASAHVWSATIDGTQQEVAIKIVNPRPDLLEPSIFKNLSERFAREAKNGEAITHECLVDVRDYGRYRNTPFLVMEMAGASAKDLLTRDGPIPVLDTLKIIRRCVNGLEFLHSLGCIHRDIKPGNILATKRGYVLADLGIVKWSDLNLSFLEAGTITTASMNLGSVSYIAPEQKRDGHAALPASDIYSLGVSWYELLTGDRLIPEAFASGNAPPPTGDAALDDLIKRMTNYDPSIRPTLKEIDNFLIARGEL
ncbi:MAG: serine/threonine-protein kinase [Bradyrhizobium sp.]|uniref:serine/threonine-protein kinase n=1 Tax=Bradyrhizobium sp. TaxID=376 RepID=UPI003D0FF8D1